MAAGNWPVAAEGLGVEEQKLLVNWLLHGSSPSCSVSRSRNPSPGRHWHPASTVVVVAAAAEATDCSRDGEGLVVAVEVAWLEAVE